MQVGDFVEAHGWKVISFLGTVAFGIHGIGYLGGSQYERNLIKNEIAEVKEYVKSESAEVKREVSEVKASVNTVITILGGK